MKKVIVTLGLSGSGKTTWANEFVAANPDTTVVCKDDIRLAMGATPNGQRVKESKVVERRNELILEAINKGQNVIVADTNLNPVHSKNIKALVFPKYRNSYEFEIKDFTDVPVNVCIERCSKRPEGKDFWKSIIMKQKSEWLPAAKKYTHPEYYLGSKPKCVIFDLDGTLAIMNGRSPFDDARCFEDLPNYPMVDIAKMYANFSDIEVICLSGRDEGRARQVTENWLRSHDINFDKLFMRAAGDSRKDSIVKREIYEKHIKDNYLVYAVFDDRPQVCRELWAEEGLPLFQFGNPYHEF